MTIQEYIDSLNKRFKTGISREHTYRTDLEQLIRTIVTGVEITNEPANVTDCGNPDYVITKGKIPVGYIEAKDIGKDLNSKGYKEQFTRYKKALDNLIITDYTWFRFFQNGELVHEIKIAEIEDNSIKPISDNFKQFENLIKNFCTFVGQTIKSSKRLAEMMAAKARLLENTIENALKSDEKTQENTSLRGQYESFKHILIHDLTPKGFADIYAQTLAYGMFAARLHDPTLDDFSRQEAAELIPKTNPFLRKLFGYIAGPDIDDRIKRTVDNLAEVFRATNVDALLHNFGKSTQMHDPIIHFYETFLSEYDPKLRKAKGVWYTPEPVVNFIVRAVDDILKTEFDIKDGLADTSKTKIKVKTQSQDKRTANGYKEVEQEVHKVQILDPATGTGTFLAEVVKHIYNNKFKAMQGAWSGYVEDHLIPRLNGFELLMASYSMAHLKLDMLLAETRYKAKNDQRFNIFLTNSLEEHHPDSGTLFAGWLSSEANEANKIKRDTPVMCVIGNPPYSGESLNKGEWIMNLMEDYKKEPGGKIKLQEKNSKFINDDYVKFLRYGQHFIEKNNEGVLAFINNHGFLDNPTFRGMRWNLLKTFDKIHIIDLHGNSKKKEVSPDGSPDKNVFDILPGVSINLFIKTGKKKKDELGEVFHFDVYGTRESKYNFLWSNSLDNTNFNKVDFTEPHYFFINKNKEGFKSYQNAFSIIDLFQEYSLGVLSKNDSITIAYDKPELANRINQLTTLSENEARIILDIKSDSRDWILHKAISDLKENYSNDNYKNIVYRPFDNRITYFTGKPKGFFAYSQNRVMRNLKKGNNFALITGRQGQAVGQMQWNLSFITNTISDQNIYYRGGGTVLPLYIYSESFDQQIIETNNERTPNLNQEIINQIAKNLGLTFTNEKENKEKTFAPIDILDYIYAVLHSPTYREKYKEFLKIDFPRVPYPKDQETFWKLVKLGGELRQIHLLESPKVEQYITQYPADGDNLITRKIGKSDWEITDSEKQLGRIWINDEQYFENIPLVAWEFYIGGYQPAQKWLKDRKERQLSFEDILHYQKIIVALSETDRIMKEIDKIEIE
ncbi:MAG: N-6 DNA methylase [Bacteroidales bacterium]|nr:N-6 DNA methylase [Bacteroidales bacterium]